MTLLTWAVLGQLAFADATAQPLADSTRAASVPTDSTAMSAPRPRRPVAAAPT